MDNIPKGKKVEEILCRKQDYHKAMFKKPGFDIVGMYQCSLCHSMLDTDDYGETKQTKRGNDENRQKVR